MQGMKRGTLVAVTLMMIAVLISACEQPYSTPAAVTNTPINQENLFATPASGNPTGLSPAEVFATQTAQLADPNLVPTSTATLSGATNPTATQTPLVLSLPNTTTPITPTATLVLPVGVTSSPIPAGSRPPTYTLQSQEFPFCIARRYNLDPESLLAQNGINNGTVFYAGVVLNLTNVASPFPDTRALRPHPTSYTVTGNADTTVYGVACKFGDLEPSAIVSANPGISLSSTLTVGQTLNIP